MSGPRRHAQNLELECNREAARRLKDLSVQIGDWRKQAAFLRVWSEQATPSPRVREDTLNRARDLLDDVRSARQAFDATRDELTPPLAANSRFADVATALDQIDGDLARSIATLQQEQVPAP